MKKLISPDFFPNFEKDDYDLIKKILFRRKNLIEGESIDLFIRGLDKFFPKGKIFLFSSERGALETFLRFYLSKEKRKKVIAQAFTCFVVPKAIINAKGIPVFVDIKDGCLNFDVENLKKVYDNDVSIVITQNTFGVPNNIEDIVNFCKDNNILLIENLAHSFSSKYKGTYLGNFGDVAVFSLGRTKVISSIFGGVLVINNENLANEFEEYYKNIPYPRKKFILKSLASALLMIKFREKYFSYGKLMMYLLRRLGLVTLDISKKERLGYDEDFLLCKLPNAFAEIAFNQLRKIIKFNEHREKIAKIYLKEGLIPYGEKLGPEYEFYYLRYPMTTLKPKKLIEKMKNYGIYLGDWYKSPLAPLEKRLDRFGYYYGMCPNAEKLSMMIYNLPTNILTTEDDAYLIPQLLKK
ncbi:MAG: DegT/DnrJ/EryC1/StrS family aminotransferase [Minisyncoccia bacterium]